MGVISKGGIRGGGGGGGGERKGPVVLASTVIYVVALFPDNSIYMLSSLSISLFCDRL